MGGGVVAVGVGGVVVVLGVVGGDAGVSVGLVLVLLAMAVLLAMVISTLLLMRSGATFCLSRFSRSLPAASSPLRRDWPCRSRPSCSPRLRATGVSYSQHEQDVPYRSPVFTK